jgi:hypothetical protein
MTGARPSRYRQVGRASAAGARSSRPALREWSNPRISGGWGIALDAAYVFFGGFDSADGFLSRLTRSATCAP